MPHQRIAMNSVPPHKVKSGKQPATSPSQQNRAKWGGKLEFILNIIGYAVGLGNVWRFPYLCYKHGGGAFLIPYWLTVALVGMPLFYLELTTGQFASLGPLKIWSVSPIFKGLGLAMVFSNTVFAFYYTVIIAWILYYIFASMNSELPWATCNNRWNTPYCILTEDMAHINTSNVTLSNGIVVNKSELLSPSQEYYYNGVLQMTKDITDQGTMVWQIACCLVLVWIITIFVLVKGIKSLGKVVYFTTLFPYILLTIMVVRGCTLSGAREGITFYLKPDWSKLLTAKVWSDASTQVFYSLGVATSGLVAMASYNDFHNNILRDAVAVPLINCLTSFYAGFAIFSVLGYMAEKKGVDINDVVASGPGLVFVVYAEALATMPAPQLWSILFFLMMAMLGFSTIFSIMESIFCAFEDEFPDALRKTHLQNFGFRLGAVGICVLVGFSMTTQGGLYVFNIFDSALSGFPFLVIGLFEYISICWVYGWKRYSEDIAMMLGKPPSKYLQACLVFISPVILIAIILFLAATYEKLSLGKYVYPDWGDGICILFMILVLVPILVWAICVLVSRGLGKRNCVEVFKESSRPTPEWRPALPENQTGRYAHDYASTTAVSSALTNNKVEPLDEEKGGGGGEGSEGGGGSEAPPSENVEETEGEEKPTD